MKLYRRIKETIPRFHEFSLLVCKRFQEKFLHWFRTIHPFDHSNPETKHFKQELNKFVHNHVK